MEYKETEYRHYRIARTANSLAFVAFVSALFRTVLIPYLLAPISIILAVLSKGKTKSSPVFAKIAIGLSCFTLILNTAICAFSVYTVTHDPKYKQQFNSAFEQVYGISFDEYLQQLETAETPVFFQNGFGKEAP